MQRKKENWFNKNWGFVLIGISVLVLTIFIFSDLNTKLFDEDCECLEKECNVFYDPSQIKKITTDNLNEFNAQSYDGPVRYLKDGSVIFYEKRAEIIEECSCIKYQCGDS